LLFWAFDFLVTGAVFLINEFILNQSIFPKFTVEMDFRFEMFEQGIIREVKEERRNTRD